MGKGRLKVVMCLRRGRDPRPNHCLWGGSWMPLANGAHRPVTPPVPSLSLPGPSVTPYTPFPSRPCPTAPCRVRTEEGNGPRRWPGASRTLPNGSFLRHASPATPPPPQSTYPGHIPRATPAPPRPYRECGPDGPPQPKQPPIARVSLPALPQSCIGTGGPAPPPGRPAYAQPLSP